MILAYQNFRDIILAESPIIKTDKSILDGRIQSSSFDCLISKKFYRVSTSFLPRENETILQAIEQNYLYDFEIKNEGSVLESNCVYITPLIEQVELPPEWTINSTPKSSTGRIDLFVRLLSDYCGRYDSTYTGYSGPLYLEMISPSFTIFIPQLTLNQIKIRTSPDPNYLTNEEIIIMHSKYNLAFDQNNNPIPLKNLKICENGLFLSVDLLTRNVIAYKAKKYSKLLDLTKKTPKEDIFEPIKNDGSGSLILEPGEFYLLTSCERVRIPPEIAGELTPYDISYGELRTHYAGHFDNGFGFGKEGELRGATAVFEVRANTVPYRITHGRVLGKMMYQKTIQIPEMLYGNNALKSNYNYTEPKLGKFILGDW